MVNGLEVPVTVLSWVRSSYCSEHNLFPLLEKLLELCSVRNLAGLRSLSGYPSMDSQIMIIAFRSILSTFEKNDEISHEIKDFITFLMNSKPWDTDTVFDLSGSSLVELPLIL
jgi:hypothetical protein